jgi:hypothetical protein
LTLVVAELGPDEERMREASRVRGDHQVRLVEEVLPLHAVVIAGEAHLAARRVHGPREHVLVELVVVAVARAVAQRVAAGEAVLDERREDVRGDLRVAHVRVAEERAGIRREGPAPERRDPAIGRAVVVEELVAGAQHGAGAEHDGYGRVHAVAFEARVLAVRVRLLVDAGRPQRQPGIHRLPEVAGHAAVLPRAELQRELA